MALRMLSRALVSRTLPAVSRSPQYAGAKLCSATLGSRQADFASDRLLQRFVSLRCFSVAAAAKATLAEDLQAEIDYEHEQYKRPQEAESPPKPWTLTEEPGSALITLAHSYKGEQVQVELSVDDQDTAPLADADEDDDDAEEPVDVDLSVVFNARIVKGDQSLLFELRSDGNYLEVQHVAIEPAEGEEDETLYTGPVFEELDEKVQKGFQEYLEERGIDNELGDYLIAISEDKEQREYISWLDRVKNFVK